MPKDYYKDLKKAEKELRELNLFFYSPSLSFEEVSKKMTEDSLEHETKEEFLKNTFELGFTTMKKGFIPTQKAMRIQAFIEAYHQFCISSGQNIDFEYALFHLYQLYGQGKSLPENVLMNPKFVEAYKERIEKYKLLIKK